MPEVQGDGGDRRVRTPSLQRRCVYCREGFRPTPRLGGRQKTCGKDACRRSHRAAYRQRYRAENSQAEQDIRKKVKGSRPEGFWKRYRELHPAGTNRNRAGARLRKRLLQAGLQRQLDIVQLIDPAEKLDQVVRFATSHRSLLEECLGRFAA